MAEQEKNTSTPDNNEAKKSEKPEGNAITKLYDKLPFTYKQVDIFVKVMIIVIVALVIFGAVKGNL